jgi:hypothetical protein
MQVVKNLWITAMSRRPFRLERLLFLLGGMTLNLIPMFASHARAERDVHKMIEISSLEGMLFAVSSISIIIFTLLGWFALLLGKRNTTLFSGGIAIFLSIAIPLIIDFHLPLKISYWTYLASNIVLIAGGFRIPKQNVMP